MRLTGGRLITAICSLLLLLVFLPTDGLGAAAKRPAAHSAGRKHVASRRSAPAPGKKRVARRRPVVRGQAAPSPERIVEIQEALARSGHYRASPTGRLDGATSAALSSFQKANGLEATGKLGALTLKKLEQHGLPANSPLTATEQTGGINP